MPKLQGLITLFTLIFFLIYSPGTRAVPFESQKLAVSAANPFAVEAAKKTFAAGGNLIDAAISATLALSVTSPYYAAIGGGGFAVVHYKGKTYALDFRETAPHKTGSDYYLKKDPKASSLGGAAVGVPGAIAGFWALHKKFGSKAWSSLFSEALRLSDNGFAVSGEWNRYTTMAKDSFNSMGKNIFVPQDMVTKPGDRLTQKKLAAAFRIIQAQGAHGFYEGPIARDIVNSVVKSGGELSLEDLENYRVEWRDPIEFNYKNYRILTMPPPSSSAVVMGAAFHIFERKNISALAPGSAAELHLIAETLKRGFRGRFLLADPKFNPNPMAKLLDSKYLESLTNSINDKKSTKVEVASEKEFTESQETTHISLMDAEGNAVALTITLNGNFGSGVVTDKFGIALNNEMDDFTTRPGEPNQFGLIQGSANKVEAGKRPISSMSPTLVMKDGKVIVSLGSPGGPRIISAVTQVIHRVLDNDLDMDQAIQFVRVHHQILPDKIYVDPLRSSPDTLAKLKDMGHQTEESVVAKVYGVRRNAKGWLEAAHDSRGEGASGGL